MSLDDLDAIDALGVDRASGEVILNILDGWGWDDEDAHLLALQAKLNRYFAFVESGQIDEVEPSWREHGARIDVFFRVEPPVAAIALLKTAEFVARPLQLGIRHSVHDS